MKEVICDTMIWYEIAKGNIEIEKLKDIKLIATGINIAELVTSENLYREYELIKKTVKAVYEHHHQLILYDPWDYLIETHVQIEFTPIKTEGLSKDLEAVNLILSESVDEFMNSNKNELVSVIMKLNEPIKKFVGDLNVGLLNTREKWIEKLGSRKHYINYLRENDDLYDEILQMIINIFADILNVNRNDLIGRINWSEFNFFVQIWTKLFADKIIMRQAKFHDNDIFDLFNMAYVGSSDYYWTLEKNPWLRLINSDENTKKHLFHYGH